MPFLRRPSPPSSRELRADPKTRKIKRGFDENSERNLEERWKELSLTHEPALLRDRSRSNERAELANLCRGTKTNLVTMLYSLTAPE